MQLYPHTHHPPHPITHLTTHHSHSHNHTHTPNCLQSCTQSHAYTCRENPRISELGWNVQVLISNLPSHYQWGNWGPERKHELHKCASLSFPTWWKMSWDEKYWSEDPRLREGRKEKLIGSPAPKEHQLNLLIRKCKNNNQEGIHTAPSFPWALPSLENNKC